MLIYAGIDEAGYGPMLGPLCVASAVFRLPEYDPKRGAPDLWTTLKKAVCRSRRDAKTSKIAVDDSKQLKGARDARHHPLTHLERGVLSFARAIHGDLPLTDQNLLSLLNTEAPVEDWYHGLVELPVGDGADRLRILSSGLSRELRRANVSIESMRCEMIDARPFNSQVDRMGTKAAVNMGAALRLIDDVWQRWPDAHPRLMIDRHGGRSHYREDLQMAWPGASIRILAERDGLSRYRLDESGRRMTITFRKEADSLHLPVALASMTAKYVRELMMIRLNRYFTGHVPELKPTAGYVQDGRRYLKDIGPVMKRLGVRREALVRSV